MEYGYGVLIRKGQIPIAIGELRANGELPLCYMEYSISTFSYMELTVYMEVW